MRYFRVEAGSVHFCNFDSAKVFAAENAEVLWVNEDFLNFLEDTKDYINGDLNDDDIDMYGDGADLVSVKIDEITEEEYLEEKEWQ
jgi:hypothetical protein